MGRLGFYFEQDKCWGCRSCEIACKDVNDLAAGEAYRRVITYECGSYPNAKVVHYTASCNHCENPACVENCPTGAMHKANDGTVQHNDDVCIGCDTCVHACPYGVPLHHSETSIVGKCDSCYSLRAQGIEPSCVASCIGRALHFGDLDELMTEFGADAVDGAAFLPEPTTGPSVRVKLKAVPDDSYRARVI